MDVGICISSRFYSTGGKIAFDVHLMQSDYSVSIAVDMGNHKAGFQLTADLFFYCVGKLDATIILFQLLPLLLVFQWIKGHGIDDRGLILIDKIIDTVIKTAQQYSAVF